MDRCVCKYMTQAYGEANDLADLAAAGRYSSIRERLSDSLTILPLCFGAFVRGGAVQWTRV